MEQENISTNPSDCLAVEQFTKAGLNLVHVIAWAGLRLHFATRSTPGQWALVSENPKTSVCKKNGWMSIMISFGDRNRCVSLGQVLHHDGPCLSAREESTKPRFSPTAKIPVIFSQYRVV